MVFSDHQQANYQQLATRWCSARSITGARPRLKVLLVDERPASGQNLAIETAGVSPERVP